MPSRAEEKLVRALHRRKIRESEGLFLAEGVRVVDELLGSPIDLVLSLAAPSLEDTARGRELAVRLARSGVHRSVGEGQLRALSATEAPQGVLAVGRVPRAELASLKAARESVGVVLDGIQDPGNFGAIARCADAFGAAFVMALPGTVDPWNPKAVRAAAGSSFHLPVLQPSLEEALEWLRANEFALLGADAAGRPVDARPAPARAALVLGNEGAGLGEAVRSAADELIAVPIRGGAESLNVGVAAGILLYALTRSR